jgi:serine/threonine protein kinase
VGPSVGDLLDGRYQLLVEIKSGGMGTVFRARDVRLNRPVAVKVIREEYSADPAYRRRFLQEAEVAKQIQHPNIIPLHDAGAGADLYMVMAFVDGADLGDRLNVVGTLSLSETIRIGTQVANALDALHRQNLIHRDVKPENVLLTSGHGPAHAYLTDFGIARSTTGLRATLTGELIGSLPYCSPERFQGDPGGESCDVYALGCLVFKCLTGQPPFRGPTHVDYFRQHRFSPPPPLGNLVDGIPPGFEDLVAAALDKDPSKRPAAASLMTLLERVASGTPGRSSAMPPAAKAAPPEPVVIPWRQPSPPPAPPIPPTRHQTPAGRTPQRHPARRRSAYAAVTILFVAAIATAAGFALHRTTQKEPTASSSQQPQAAPATPSSDPSPASTTGVLTPAESALFSRISVYSTGPCEGDEVGRGHGQTAGLACKPGGGVDSFLARQFPSSDDLEADALDRQTRFAAAPALEACDANATEYGNPDQAPAHGQWHSHGEAESKGTIRCYAQTLSSGSSRVLIVTYPNANIEIALIRNENSVAAAQGLFDWWKAHIQQQDLAPSVS